MMLGHPTKDWYNFKDILQTLVDVEVLKLCPKPKMVTTNITSSIQFGQHMPAPTKVTPFPREELHIINSNLHHRQEAEIMQVPTPDGGLVLIHPNIVEDLGQ